MHKGKVEIAVLALVAVAFLALGCADSGKIKQLESEVNRMGQLVQDKDAKIQTLTAEAQAGATALDAARKELESTKAELASVRNEMDLSKSTLDAVQNELAAAKSELEALKPSAPAPTKTTK